MIKLSFTVREVAEILEMNPKNVYRYIETGKLNIKMASKRQGIVITYDDLYDFVSDRGLYLARFQKWLVKHPESDQDVQLSEIQSLYLGLSEPLQEAILKFMKANQEEKNNG